MKIISSLFLIFQLSSLTVLANIGGEWSGWAYWKYDGDGPNRFAHGLSRNLDSGWIKDSL